VLTACVFFYKNMTHFTLHNRFGSYHSDVGDHLFDVTGYCAMLAPKCPPCTRICFHIWNH